MTGVQTCALPISVTGTSSNTTAIIESYITQPINQNILATLYISNVKPLGGSFVKGEKIVVDGLGVAANSAAVSAAPTVTGSLSSLSIINGGENFNIGDIIKIAHYNSTNNAVISHGVDGLLRVTGLQRQLGAINFNIIDGGFGYDENLKIFIYRGDGDTTGTSASFEIGSLSYNQSIRHNTDVIVDYANLQFNSLAFGFPANTSANSISLIQNALTYTYTTYGTLATLTNVFTGNNYTQTPFVFVRSVTDSRLPLEGSITYTTSSNTITGSGTYFKIGRAHV